MVNPNLRQRRRIVCVPHKCWVRRISSVPKAPVCATGSRMSDWYYSIDETNRHQATDEEMMRLAASGVLKPTSLVWKDGMGDWIPAAKVNPGWFAMKSAVPSAADGETPPPTPAVVDQPPPPPADQPPPAPLGMPGTAPTYGAPAYGTPGQPIRLDPFAGGQPITEPLAIISLVTGILGLFPGLCCCLVGLPLTVSAIVCGHLALTKIKKFEGHLTGREMALVGLGLGYLAVLWMVGSFVVRIITGGMSAAMEGLQHGMRR